MKPRIGDRVRALVDDVNVSVGLEGLIVNVTTPNAIRKGAARVLWANETVSLIASADFEVLPRAEVAS